MILHGRKSNSPAYNPPGSIGSSEIAGGAIGVSELDNLNARQADVAWIESRLAAYASKSRLQPSVEIISDTSATVRRPLGGLDFERLDVVRTDTGRTWSLRGQAIFRDAAWQHLSANPTVAGTWSPVFGAIYPGGSTIQNATDSGTQTLTVSVTGQGQLWLRHTRRLNAGITEVSVLDSFGVERCSLPVHPISGLRFYDGYGPDLTDDVLLIASGLGAGTYTVRFTKQATYKNDLSTGFRSLPVALGFVDPNAPSFGSREQLRVTSLPRTVVTTQAGTPTTRSNASNIGTSGDFSALTFAVNDSIDIGHIALAGFEHVAYDFQFSTPNANASTLAADVLTSERVQIVINATGGTFTVTFGGNTTSAIAWNATAATLQTALQGLASIGANRCMVTKTGNTFVLLFDAAMGNVGAVTTNAASLTGGTATAAVTVLAEGAATAATITDGTNGLRQNGRIIIALPSATMPLAQVNGSDAGGSYIVRLRIAGTATSAVTCSSILVTTRQTSAPILVATLIGNITEVGYAVDVRFNNVWAEGGGQAHGMETPTSSRILVDGLDIGGPGAYGRGSRITFRDVGNLVHPQGVIGTFQRDHAISRDRTDISGVWTFTQAVTIGQGTGAGTIGNSFPAMWACGLSSAGAWQMRQAAILHRPLVVRDLTTATSRTLFGQGTPGIGWIWADSAHPYAVVAWMARPQDTLNGGGANDVYLDANRANVAIPANGSDSKGYAQMAERFFAAGEVFSMGVSSTTIRASEFLASLR